MVCSRRAFVQVAFLRNRSSHGASNAPFLFIDFTGMIDQLVATRGRNFLGCWFSTFTVRGPSFESLLFCAACGGRFE
jgi:hypothetical protein